MDIRADPKVSAASSPPFSFLSALLHRKASRRKKGKNCEEQAKTRTMTTATLNKYHSHDPLSLLSLLNPITVEKRRK